MINNFIINSGNSPAISTGNFADRGNAVDYTYGSLYSSIDTGNLAQSDGSNWIDLSSGGGGVNIYNSDGTLTGPRDVFCNSNILRFREVTLIRFDDTNNNEGFVMDFSFANEKIYTIHQGNDNGLKLDFPIKQYKLGDFNNTLNGTHFIVDDLNESILTYGSQQKGLSLLFNINKYLFGDTSDLNNGINLIVDDANYLIYFQQPAGPEGILVNFLTGDYKFGDFNNNNVGNAFLIENVTSTFKTVNGGADVGLYLNIGANSTFYFGDYNNLYNGTAFQILDGSEVIRTLNNNQTIGLKLDFNKDEYLLGDHSNVINGHYLRIDNANALIATYQYNIQSGIFMDASIWKFGNFGGSGCWAEFTAGHAEFTGNFNNSFFRLDDSAEYLQVSNNLTTTTAGLIAAKFIKIRIAGTNYKIPLHLA